MTPKGCIYFSNLQRRDFYAAYFEPCGNPAVADGPHGFLCPEHRKLHEQELAAARKANTVVPGRNTEQDLVNGIILTESRAISRGCISHVRLGSLDPIYIRFVS